MNQNKFVIENIFNAFWKITYNHYAILCNPWLIFKNSGLKFLYINDNFLVKKIN